VVHERFPSGRLFREGAVLLAQPGTTGLGPDFCGLSADGPDGPPSQHRRDHGIHRADRSQDAGSRAAEPERQRADAPPDAVDVVGVWRSKDAGATP